MGKKKLVYGVGITDLPTSENGKQIKSYTCWLDMLKRCYSEKYQITRPTYFGCSVCNDWLYFSNYKKWHDLNYKEGFDVDKDLLIFGNKVYSPDSCRFVPSYINSLLTDHGRARGKWPIGVTYYKKRKSKPFYSQCSDGHGNRIFKFFATVEEAVAFYSTTKTRIVKQQADRALAAGDVDIYLYMSLVSRKF